MTNGERSELKELRTELLAEIRAMRAEFGPVLEFHQRALGVLAVARFLGPIGALGALAGIAWALGLFRL